MLLIVHMICKVDNIGQVLEFRLKDYLNLSHIIEISCKNKNHTFLYGQFMLLSKKDNSK